MPAADLLFPELHAARYGDNRRRGALIIARKLEQAGADMRLRGAQQDAAFDTIRKWAGFEADGSLLRFNETQLEAEFLTDVFGGALGYALFSDGADRWELRPRYRVNGQEADAALGLFARDSETLRVLIELKGPRTNVDKVTAGRARSPVNQLWDYLNVRTDCPWGIVCNYVSFRLYRRDRGTRYYEHFTLDEIARRRERFNEFYALFQRDGLLPTHPGAEPRADRLVRETGERQREVGDELYERYSAERQGLIHHLHDRRKLPLDEAIRIAQRLIDRIIFIAFCEDRGLLTANTLRKTFDHTPMYEKATNPRWRNFIRLFGAVDTGHSALGIEHGYNGNLFKPDPAIDNLELDDSWTNFFAEVGDYDFRDEINVDVLGNLFERSVTELEKLRVGIFGLETAEPGSARMPKSAERKRFGTYYTPPEFTRFLVEQTVGVAFAERCDQAARRHNLTHPVGDGADPAARRAYARAALDACRDIRILDPACGSGAFLIAAYDFLAERFDDVIDVLENAGEPPAAVAALRDQVPDWILSGNLYGVDLSAEAVEITQLALWIRSARPGKTLADLSQHIHRGNSLVDHPAVAGDAAFNWRDRFRAVFDRPAAGFDCVIGNPPWERLKLQEREFFSLSAPDIAAAVSAASRRQRIATLETTNPALFARYQQAKARADAMLAYARQSGRYPLTGRGDINTYMLFAELARSIVAPNGLVGLLVPSGIATDDTTKDYFAALMQSKALRLLYDFENKKPWFPDVHRSFKFCTLVFGGAQRRHPAADFVFFAHAMDDLGDRQRHIPLTADDLALLNPNTRTCPIFRSRRDAELTKAIYRNVPILIDESRQSGGNPWGIRFFTMFHQTNDAELFHTDEQLVKMGFKRVGNRWRKGRQVFLPLYEAKMIQAFDHRAAGVIVEEGNWVRQGQTKETSLVQHQNPEFTVTPRWWTDKTKVDDALAHGPLPALLAYKDVTSATNQRTMIAAFIPYSAVVNSAPLVLMNSVGWRLAACLLGNLNSFALDFVARQKVGGVHLNFFIVEQFPILPPDRYAEKCPWSPRSSLEKWISDRVLKLTCTANDMIPLAEAADFEPRVQKWNPEERARLRAELDAAFFHLYRIGRDDAEYILSTFQGLREAAAPPPGESSAAQILAEYDRLAG